jgi:hypothetical protein
MMAALSATKLAHLRVARVRFVGLPEGSPFARTHARTSRSRRPLSAFLAGPLSSLLPPAAPSSAPKHCLPSYRVGTLNSYFSMRRQRAGPTCPFPLTPFPLTRFPLAPPCRHDIADLAKHKGAHTHLLVDVSESAGVLDERSAARVRSCRFALCAARDAHACRLRCRKRGMLRHRRSDGRCEASARRRHDRRRAQVPARRCRRRILLERRSRPLPRARLFTRVDFLREPIGAPAGRSGNRGSDHPIPPSPARPPARSVQPTSAYLASPSAPAVLRQALQRSAAASARGCSLR